LDVQPVRSGKKVKAASKTCWDFEQKGSCKFGDKCRFSHGAPPSEDQGGAANPEQQQEGEAGCSGGGAAKSDPQQQEGEAGCTGGAANVEQQQEGGGSVAADGEAGSIQASVATGGSGGAGAAGGASTA